jgi:hypothetical protein
MIIGDGIVKNVEGINYGHLKVLVWLVPSEIEKQRNLKFVSFATKKTFKYDIFP